MTDDNPLCYLNTTAKLGVLDQRWAAQLALFNFTIRYRPGKQNQAADALSRLPLGETPPEREEDGEVGINSVWACSTAIPGELSRFRTPSSTPSVMY